MIYLGDSLHILSDLPSDSVDAVVTDPPYGLSFMGKKWDYDVPSVEFWREVLRVMKPGAHVLSFGGTRTYHRMVVNIEDAGFEIRDQVQWIYGQGFPKSLNVNKKCGISICGCKQTPEHELRSMRGSDLSASVDAEKEPGQVLQSSVSQQSTPSPVLWDESEKSPAAPKESSVEGRCHLQEEQGQLHRTEVCEVPGRVFADGSQRRLRDGASADCGEDGATTPESNGSSSSHRPQYEKQSPQKFRALANEPNAQTSGAWPRCDRCGKPILPDGLGSALKPSNEPIVLARKPLERGLTVAENVLKYGTGAINVGGSRIATSENLNGGAYSKTDRENPFFKKLDANAGEYTQPQGRWPANVLFGCDCVLCECKSPALVTDNTYCFNCHLPTKAALNGKQHFSQCAAAMLDASSFHWSNGIGPSRFFYVAKASKRERNAGLEGMPERERPLAISQWKNQTNGSGEVMGPSKPQVNHHPTVKPLKLMEYLIKLITPPGGVVLDPFMGSGSTGVAAKSLGFKFIGIEREPEYVEIARRRLEHHEIPYCVEEEFTF